MVVLDGSFVWYWTSDSNGPTLPVEQTISHGNRRVGDVYTWIRSHFRMYMVGRENDEANVRVQCDGMCTTFAHFVAPSNASNCSVLTTPCKQPSKLLKYVTFLGCELNSDIEQLTDEEDAQHANQVPIVFSAIATIGGLTGKVPGWAGITGAVTGGIYTIGIAAKSNQECTGSVYGH
jgi:hypothetical protein